MSGQALRDRAASIWLPIIYADKCRGFLARHRAKFEVFDLEEASLGIFETEAEAVTALFSKGGANNK